MFTQKRIKVKKIIKLETKFLKKVIKQLSGNVTEEDLLVCQKTFDIFCKKMKMDKLALLRKGEVMLRRIFI